MDNSVLQVQHAASAKFCLELICVTMMLTLVLGLASCNSTAMDTAGASRDSGTGNSFDQIVPPAGLVSKNVSSTSFVRLGMDFEEEMPHNRVEVVFNSAVFTPEWDIDSGSIEELAYAVYAFDLSGFTGTDSLNFHWSETGNFDVAWVGLSDYTNNRWSWFELPQSGVLNVNFADFTSPSGQMLVLPMLGGFDRWTLAWIRCGDDDGSPWFHSWGTTRDNGIRDVCVDSAGNVYTCGITSIGVPGYAQCLALITKHDCYGNFVWAKHYSRGESDEAQAICVGADDYIYITGKTQVIENYIVENSCLILKLHPKDGSIIWQKIWGGALREEGEDIICDQAGDIYISGNEDISQCLLIKYTPEGTLLWARSWGGIQMDNILGLHVDTCGNIHAAGSTRNSEASNSSMLYLKVSPDGNLLDQRAFHLKDFCGNTFGRDVVVDRYGDTIITGTTGLEDDDWKKAMILRFDTEWNLKTAIIYPGTNETYCPGMVLNSDNEAYCLVLSATAEIELVLTKLSGSDTYFPSRRFHPLNVEQNDTFYSFSRTALSMFPDDSIAIAADSADASTGSWSPFIPHFESVEMDLYNLEYEFQDPVSYELSCSGWVTDVQGAIDTGGGYSDVTVQRIPSL